MALYTQNSQKIEVIVRKAGGDGTAELSSGKQGAKEVDTDDVSADNIWAKLCGSTSKRKQRRVLITNATHALAVSRQISNLWINYALTGKAYKTGDQSYQDAFQQRVEYAMDGINVASSVAMGAVYGAWGGPIGSVLGATLAGVSTGASIATKYATKDRDFSVKEFKQNNEISYMRARAGINLTTGRLR